MSEWTFPRRGEELVHSKPSDRHSRDGGGGPPRHSHPAGDHPKLRPRLHEPEAQEYTPLGALRGAGGSAEREAGQERVAADI